MRAAEALQLALPELDRVATVRLDVVGDRRQRIDLEVAAHRAEGLGSELISAAALPSGGAVPGSVGQRLGGPEVGARTLAHDERIRLFLEVHKGIAAKGCASRGGVRRVC